MADNTIPGVDNTVPPVVENELNSWINGLDNVEWVNVDKTNLLDNNEDMERLNSNPTSLMIMNPPGLLIPGEIAQNSLEITEQHMRVEDELKSNDDETVKVPEKEEEKENEEVKETEKRAEQEVENEKITEETPKKEMINPDILESQTSNSSTIQQGDEPTPVGSSAINVNELESKLLQCKGKSEKLPEEISAENDLIDKLKTEETAKELFDQMNKLVAKNKKQATMIKKYKTSLQRASTEILELKNTVTTLESKENLVKEQCNILSPNTNVVFVGFSEDVDQDIVNKLRSHYEKEEGKIFEVLYLSDYSFNDIKKAISELKGRQNTEVIMESSQSGIFMHRISEQLASIADVQDTEYICYDTPFALAQFLSE